MYFHGHLVKHTLGHTKRTWLDVNCLRCRGMFNCANCLLAFCQHTHSLTHLHTLTSLSILIRDEMR